MAFKLDIESLQYTFKSYGCGTFGIKGCGLAEDSEKQDWEIKEVTDSVPYYTQY